MGGFPPPRRIQCIRGTNDSERVEAAVAARVGRTWRGFVVVVVVVGSGSGGGARGCFRVTGVYCIERCREEEEVCGVVGRDEGSWEGW